MRNIRIHLISIVLCSLPGLTALPLQAGPVKASLNCLTFHLPDDTSYIELQYLIYGNGLRYTKTPSGKFQGRIRADLTLEATDGSIPTIHRTFHFLTAEYADSLPENKSNNYNLSRIPLPPKNYTLHLCLRDDNDSAGQPICHRTTIDLSFDRNRICASGVQLVGAYSTSNTNSVFTKNGLRMIPYFSRFYPAETDSLTYMWEIYNTDKLFPANREGWIVSSILPERMDQAVSQPLHLKYTTMVYPTPRFIHFLSIPIDSLPSGNYYLTNRLYAPDGTLLLQDSLFFQRSNPALLPAPVPEKDSLPIDTLKQFIDYLFPIAKGDEVDFIRNARKETDYRLLADFFRYFWEKRNPEDPWDAWYRYYGDVKRVNHNYTTLKFKGYKTDRGYYYLKYGAPSDIEYHPIENGLNPYEIWRYYQLEDQTDVYFIFGDLDLNTKNFTMICSNKKNEIYDPRWKFRLKPKDLRPTDIEMTE
jgi:GWxTD domain-containing protein